MVYYLLANTDRHFGNFGAVRNVNTLEWIGPAPVFDSGTSLWHDKLTRNINGYDPVETNPFYADAGRQMELVSDFIAGYRLNSLKCWRMISAMYLLLPNIWMKSA